MQRCWCLRYTLSGLDALLQSPCIFLNLAFLVTARSQLQNITGKGSSQSMKWHNGGTVCVSEVATGIYHRAGTNKNLCMPLQGWGHTLTLGWRHNADAAAA